MNWIHMVVEVSQRKSVVKFPSLVTEMMTRPLSLVPGIDTLKSTMITENRPRVHRKTSLEADMNVILEISYVETTVTILA